MSFPPSPLHAWLAGRMGLQHLSPDAATAWQMAELRRTIQWARAASRFHAERLAGLDPEQLRTPADMVRLPRMGAAELAAPGLLTMSQSGVARVVTLPTSGSSGPPKRLHFSEADLARTIDFFAVGMHSLCGQGDVVLVLLPGRREWGVADLLTRALPRIGARAVAPPEAWTADDLPALLHAEGITSLIAAPTQLRRLLKLPHQVFRGRIRTLLSSAEHLTNALRAELAKAWDCAVFDHWGMTETGYGGGVECSAHSGYHLREADLFLEVVDFITGAPVSEGQPGELLLTTLGERAMPLLRYRTGDAGRFLPGPCPCGCALRRLAPVPGRLAADGTGITQQAKGWVAQP